MFKLLTTIKLLSNLMSNESYSLIIPSNINLSDTGSFQISLSQNNLSESQTLDINIDESFVLTDTHGKPNIIGNIINNEISFTNSDTTKTINYEVINASVGEWTGTLNLSINLSTIKTYELIDGRSLNTILKNINPTTITFSHDVIEDGIPLDISKNQDSSVLLYESNSNVIITNEIDIPIKANTSCLSMFSSLNNLQYIYNLNYLDTTNCTSMSKMFQNCPSLVEADVSSFNTNNITNISYMFERCYNLECVGNISNWDVSNVTNTSNLFASCYKLDDYGDISNWNITNKCKDMSFMFSNMSHTPNQSNSSFFPSYLDLSNWDVSNVTDMSSMFKNTFSLQTLNISGWNTSKLKKTDNMFEMNDLSLTSNLQNIIGIEDLDVSSLIQMSSMFAGCTNFDGDLSLWQPIRIVKLDYAFFDCSLLDLTQFNNWDTYFSARTTYTGIFNSRNGTLPNAPSWFN